MNFVAFDFETANEKRDSACALGLTIVREGTVTETLHYLIRPAEMRFSDWNIRVHGITPRDVSRSPSIGKLWPTIAHHFENQLVVAHNTSFDMSVLRHSLLTDSIDVPQLSHLCTLKLARKIWPTLGCYKLDFLADCHGVQLDHHHAGSDSRAAADLLLIAARSRKVACPRVLADSVGVKIGEVKCGHPATS